MRWFYNGKWWGDGEHGDEPTADETVDMERGLTDLEHYDATLDETGLVIEPDGTLVSGVVDVAV